MKEMMPADVNIHKSQKTALELCLAINNGEIILPSETDESREIMSSYIESVMLLIPLVPICMYYDKIGNGFGYFVFAGGKVIKAINRFINGKFQLEGMQYYREYEGCGFDSIPACFRRRISTCYMTVYTIPPSTPEETKNDLIKRMTIMYR